jgi:hypothetical protein
LDGTTRKLFVPNAAKRRRPVRLVLMLLLTAVAAILAVVLLNLSWFDEPLLPELEALRKPQPAALDGNAFPFALGFWPRTAVIHARQASKSSASCRHGATAVNRRPSARKKSGPSSASRWPLADSVSGRVRQRRHRQGRSRSARFACLGTAWIARSS